MSSTKVCAKCGKTGVQFSKAQQKKADGKCVDCVQAAEQSGATTSPVKPTESSPSKPVESPKPVTPKVAASEPAKVTSPKAAEPSKASSPRPSEPPKQSSKATVDGSSSSTSPRAQKDFFPVSEPSAIEKDDADTWRFECEACGVYKPKERFDENSKLCKVCVEAKKKGVRATTMKDHGLVSGDGFSIVRLGWIPENFLEWLAYMQKISGNQEGNAEDQEEEEPGEDEYEHDYDEEN